MNDVHFRAFLFTWPGKIRAGQLLSTANAVSLLISKSMNFDQEQLKDSMDLFEASYTLDLFAPALNLIHILEALGRYTLRHLKNCVLAFLSLSTQLH